MLTVRGVTKQYRVPGSVPVDALRGVDMDVGAGEFVGLVGPSGSGKTTLFNLIGCIDRATSGSIRIGSAEIGALSDRELVKLRRNRIGYVFQFFNLIPSLTAQENAELPLWPLSRDRKRAGRERIIKLFDRFGMSDLRRRFPHQLSGGQKQRVAVIRSLANAPSLVIADEPTGNLDTENSKRLMEILKAENADHGSAFLVATHNQEIVPYFSRTIQLRDGRVLDGSMPGKGDGNAR